MRGIKKERKKIHVNRKKKRNRSRSRQKGADYRADPEKLRKWGGEREIRERDGEIIRRWQVR